MKTASIRICAPLAVLALASSDGQRFSAAKLLKSVSNRGLVPGVDIAFEKRDANSVEMTVLNLAGLQKLQGLMTGGFDQPSENPRFFQPTDDGRFKAMVTHDLLAEHGSPKTTPTQDKWRHAVNELAQHAPVSMMPPSMSGTEAEHVRQRA